MLYYITWSMYLNGETLRRGERTWSNYWNQLLRKIISSTMLARDPTDPIISINEKAHARKRILLLGMIYTSYKYVSVPKIYLSGTMILKMSTRKARGKDVKLKIRKFSDFEMHQLRSVLESIN